MHLIHTDTYKQMHSKIKVNKSYFESKLRHACMSCGIIMYLAACFLWAQCIHQISIRQCLGEKRWLLSPFFFFFKWLGLHWWLSLGKTCAVVLFSSPAWWISSETSALVCSSCNQSLVLWVAYLCAQGEACLGTEQKSSVSFLLEH